VDGNLHRLEIGIQAIQLSPYHVGPPGAPSLTIGPGRRESWRAVVPFTFRIQISHPTQEPPSKSLPAGLGIQQSASRRTSFSRSSTCVGRDDQHARRRAGQYAGRCAGGAGNDAGPERRSPCRPAACPTAAGGDHVGKRIAGMLATSGIRTWWSPEVRGRDRRVGPVAPPWIITRRNRSRRHAQRAISPPADSRVVLAYGDTGRRVPGHRVAGSWSSDQVLPFRRGSDAGSRGRGDGGRAVVRVVVGGREVRQLVDARATATAVRRVRGRRPAEAAPWLTGWWPGSTTPPQRS